MRARALGAAERRAEAPSKVTLRALLTREAPRLGLTAAAIDEIVRQSQITYWRAGQEIFSQGESHDLVNFLVAGAVRVVCEGFHRVPVVVQIVRPAHFFGLGSLFDSPGPRLFGAVAHVDAVVAVMSQDALNGVMAALPPGCALQVMAYSWRVLSRLLYEKCLQLTLPLRDRLIHELGVLAHDFGDRRDDGILIDLPLTQADLAALVVASRANVSRCVVALRRAGLVEFVGRRLFLTARFPGLGVDGAVPFGTRIRP
jgi:CRP/FNR family transcriptional regulator